MVFPHSPDENGTGDRKREIKNGPYGPNEANGHRGYAAESEKRVNGKAIIMKIKENSYGLREAIEECTEKS